MGNEAIVKLLLENGAVANADALQAASNMGNEAIHQENSKLLIHAYLP